MGIIHYAPTDPYERLALDCDRFAPGYAERLKQAGVFDNLDPHDVSLLCRAIADAMSCWGCQDPRGVNALRQKAANAGCGSDLTAWVDRAAVSRALGLAADALAAP